MITRRAFLSAAAGAAAAAACGSRGPVLLGTGARRDLERRVGELLFLGWLGAPVPASLRRRVERGELGGLVVFRRNAGGAAALAETIHALRRAAPPDGPILVAATQEGGAIRPLAPEMTAWPAASRLGARAARSDADRRAAESLAAAWGRALGAELAALGIDVDFAPVLDVDTNPNNPIIGARAFSTDARDVTRLAGACARGLAAAGAMACGKHFPGHGDTDVDSHVALPRVERDAGRLRAVELAPFRALGPSLPMIMTAHVVYPALDPAAPATLSPAITRDLLRIELDYQGVVITDDLEMRAITRHASIGDAAVAALLAGCDALLVAHHEERQELVAEALLRAASTDPIVERRVRDSSSRLRALKDRHFAARRIRGTSLAPLASLESLAPSHAALAAALAEG